MLLRVMCMSYSMGSCTSLASSHGEGRVVRVWYKGVVLPSIHTYFLFINQVGRPLDTSTSTLLVRNLFVGLLLSSRQVVCSACTSDCACEAACDIQVRIISSSYYAIGILINVLQTFHHSDITTTPPSTTHHHPSQPPTQHVPGTK